VLRSNFNFSLFLKINNLQFKIIAPEIIAVIPAFPIGYTYPLQFLPSHSPDSFQDSHKHSSSRNSGPFYT
jgi:hypothetical protein